MHIDARPTVKVITQSYNGESYDPWVGVIQLITVVNRDELVF